MLTTGTGADAIRLLTSAPPDLVLLDLGLPDVDSTEVRREMQAAGRPRCRWRRVRAGGLGVLTTDVGDRFGLDMRKTSEWSGAV